MVLDDPFEESSEETSERPVSAMGEGEADEATVLDDDVLRSLDPKYISLEKLVGWIVCGIIGGGLIVGVVFLLAHVAMPGWTRVLVGGVVFVLCAGLAWLAHCFPGIEYRHKSYRVNGHRVEIRKGVVWRQVLDVPRSRVQHTDVEQGPIERRFGIAHLVIHTAGTMNASVTMEGLRYETAIAIRDLLVSTGRGDAV